MVGFGVLTVGFGFGTKSELYSMSQKLFLVQFDMKPNPTVLQRNKGTTAHRGLALISANQP